MSDEAQTPDPTRDRSTSSRAPEMGPARPDGEAVGRASVEPDPWAPPADDAGAVPTVSVEDVPLSGDGSGSPGAAGGPGGTVVSLPDGPLSWPPPSVHDQQTVTSMPGADGVPPGPAATPTEDSGVPAPQPWANPFAAPGAPSTPSTPGDGAAHPFAPPHASTPPAGTAQPNPFAAPQAPSPSNPFAAPQAASASTPFAAPTGPAGPAPFTSPSPATPPNPFAPPAGPTGPTGPPPYAQGAAVPPPPIAPDGPGQVPYGYPGGGYGYPGQPQGYPAQAQGYPGQHQGYYGWPGTQPLPANGMGTAGLVLGILSAIVFCLWPVAIVLGILGVIFGSIGRGKASKGMATNAGQALAGIICGAAGIVLGVGMLVLLVVT
ncbi:hypothetical protein [Streptomyces aquilus]|uniref:hypothetical protein n=1 Tax=Streptomyces aquilus TaxID=2548456 RepID=UPI00244A8FB8|nr:hypothetical protein [Streptomyces aquilus]